MSRPSNHTELTESRVATRPQTRSKRASLNFVIICGHATSINHNGSRLLWLKHSCMAAPTELLFGSDALATLEAAVRGGSVSYPSAKFGLHL